VKVDAGLNIPAWAATVAAKDSAMGLNAGLAEGQALLLKSAKHAAELDLWRLSMTDTELRASNLIWWYWHGK